VKCHVVVTAEDMTQDFVLELWPRASHPLGTPCPWQFYGISLNSLDHF